MTTITNLHQGNPDAAKHLIESVPVATVAFDRDVMIHGLPDILESALAMLLDDIDTRPGKTTSGAVGCRIIAACVSRLRM